MFKLFLFALLSCVVPFGDVGTDGITVYDLYRNGQTLWAAATFYFMWNPFVLHLLRFNRHILVHVPSWRFLPSIFLRVQVHFQPHKSPVEAITSEALSGMAELQEQSNLSLMKRKIVTYDIEFPYRAPSNQFPVDMLRKRIRPRNWTSGDGSYQQQE